MRRGVDALTARMFAWKQQFIERVRNSSLFERPCAETNRKSKISPKLRIRQSADGRGAFCSHRSLSARIGGACRKENVGMSNDKMGGKPIRQKTRVSSIYANQIRVSRVLRYSRKAKPMANRLIFRYLYILRWEDGVT